MTHTGSMPDSTGKFDPWKTTDTTCHKCAGHSVVNRSWESSCGGYTDYKYRCNDCGYEWWVDGPDA